MNRRGFLQSLATAVAGFAILPSATTYARVWTPRRCVTKQWVINPAWHDAEYEIQFQISTMTIWNESQRKFIPVIFKRSAYPPAYMPGVNAPCIPLPPLAPGADCRVREIFPVRLHKISGDPIPVLLPYEEVYPQTF